MVTFYESGSKAEAFYDLGSPDIWTKDYGESEFREAPTHYLSFYPLSKK
jgi:hypothetical protein